MALSAAPLLLAGRGDRTRGSALHTLGGPKGERQALKYLIKPYKTKSYFERIWVEGRASSEFQAEYEGGLYGHMRSEALGRKSVQDVPQNTSLHSR